METRANYVLIGLFTLATIFGAFAFVYWFHHVGGVAVRHYYRVVFQGPIGGLRTGAQVNFNGIRAGEVVELTLDPNDPRQALATISVAAGTPLRADTKVTLEFQGLTGIASLALKGGDPSAAPVPRKEGELPTLVATSSASQDLMQAARDSLSKIDQAITRVDEVVAENRAAIKASLKNVETFTETLAKASPKIERIVAGVDNLIGGPEGKGDVPDAVRAIKNTAENLDKKIDGLVVDGRRTLTVIERAVRNLDENPSRLIFGGGKPGNPPPAATPQQRQASPQAPAPRRQAPPQ
jgi:phospholipid/cholesterol/gamma-HCH transport system substrate-binding protein